MNARLVPVVEWDEFNEYQDEHMQAVSCDYLWKPLQDLLESHTEADLRAAQKAIRAACVRKFREDT